MIARSLILATILGAAAACGTDAPDPQGTYHVAISAATELPFPSAISWPVASDLTLAFDAAGHAELSFLDVPAQVLDENKSPDGYLLVHMHTRFPGEVLDAQACPRADVDSNAIGATFELHFQGGHVEGVASTVASCVPSPDALSVSVVFFFDLTGDRAPQA